MPWIDKFFTKLSGSHLQVPLRNGFRKFGLSEWLPPRPVLLLVLWWTGQGALATGYLRYQYGGSRLGLMMHLAIVCLLPVVCLLPFTFQFVSAIPLLARRILLSLILGSMNYVLLLFYALTILAHRGWQGPFTFELFRTYAGQMGTVLSIYGFSVPLVAGSASAIWLFIFGAYYYFSRFLLTAFGARADGAARTPTQRHTRWRILAWSVVGLFAVVYSITHPLWLSREPLHGSWTQGRGFLHQAPDGLLFKQHSMEISGPAVSGKPFPKKIRPRPLVLITVDSLRSDQMGVYGAPRNNTPFLSGLWRQGRLHRVNAAYSICTASFCGMVGTLSSRYWHQLNEPPENLADVLKTYGYRTSFLLSGDQVNFFNLRKVFGPNIDVYRDGSLQSKQYVNDDRMVLRWLRDIDWQSSKPAFIYIHLMSVHKIGLHDPRFEKWKPDKERLMMKLSKTPRAYRNYYHNGVLQADNTIEQIFEILKEHGLLERAMVVITADHGEYLGEFNIFGHGYNPYEPVVRIPLLVYDQRQSDYPARSLASQVDVAPTMLHAIGAAVPAGWSGIPLQLSTSRNAVAVDTYEFSGVVAYWQGRRFKYLQNRKNGSEMLFDLDNANAESFNLVTQPGRKPILSFMRGLHKLTQKNR